MLRFIAPLAAASLSASTFAATITATATGTLVSATLGGTSIDGAAFTWTITFDDSSYVTYGTTNYWNSISQSSMAIAGHGTANIALSLISPIDAPNTLRFYVNGTQGFTGFTFSSTPIAGTNWTNATSGNFGAWAADITNSYNISPRTVNTAIGTLVISDSDFSTFTSGSISAVPGGSAFAALAACGTALAAGGD
ncbi:MAG: hypothetical protein ACO3ZY_14070, partial [Phycisphaerales bacterium]